MSPSAEPGRGAVNPRPGALAPGRADRAPQGCYRGAAGMPDSPTDRSSPAGSSRPGASLGWVLSTVGLLLALPPACAKRTDERVRAAWGKSSQAPGEARGGDRRIRDQEGSETESEPILRGWERIGQILDGAVAEAALGTDDEVFARLAERWCDTAPNPRRTEEGTVLVCLPDPPVQIDGQVFSLELGGEGVIGLVAAELPIEASTSLVTAALDELDRWCTHPWTDVTPSPSDPDEPATAELHTCPVEGSAVLVVARFVSSAEAEQWRVSVAVIDAS